MLSFASWTLGWSNGLIPSAQPATAVANSEKKKIRPRSLTPAAVTVIVGCPAAASARDRLRVARVGRVGVAQVQEDAVVAVGRRVGERLVGDRQDAAALLAGRLGDELLGPEPERAERRVDDERELVAAAQRELAQRGAEPQARVALGQLAVLLRDLGALEHRLDVDARERRGHDAERRERASSARRSRGRRRRRGGSPRPRPARTSTCRDR